MGSHQNKINNYYESQDTLNTKFHRAVEENKLVVVKSLVGKGANVNSRNQSGLTAAHVAIIYGNYPLLNLLINVFGADVNATDISDISLIAKACFCNDFKAVIVLTANGLNMGLDGLDKSPLHYGATNGSELICQILLNFNPDVNLRDGRNCTPLHIACMKSNLRIVQMLCKRNSIDLNAINADGQTAFMLACGVGNNIDIVTFLIGCGCNINVSDSKGRSPLDVVCARGAIDVVQILLSQSHLIRDFTNATTRNFINNYGLGAIGNC